jgi:hypothetical protein
MIDLPLEDVPPARGGTGRAPLGIASLQTANKLAGVVAVALLVFYAISSPSFTGFLCATLVSAAALLPTMLWLNGYVKGIPCFPLFAGLHIFYFGTPFAIFHPAVETYSDTEKLTAATTVVIYLLLATAVWALVGRRRGSPGKTCLALDPKSNVRRYLLLLFVGTLFNINSVWGAVDIPGEIVALMRPFLLGLSVISIFLMSYNFGAKTLTSWQKAIFLALFVSFSLTQAIGLLLISMYTCLASGLAGYWLSSRRIPKLALAIVCLLLVVMQAGKYEMRRVYLEDGYFTLSPTQYGKFFGNWLSYGVDSLVGKSDGGNLGSLPGDTENIGLLTRASLAHMLLLVQTSTPAPIPYFGGESYVGIPELLLPRFLFPDKGTIFEPMLRLSAHFGVLAIDADNVSIAWGLLPEAYGNFGYGGALGLAVVIGIFFGLFARVSTDYSVFSVRSIASIMLLTCIFGFESHAAAAVSTIFQSMVAVVVASILFARKSVNVGSEI